MENGGIRNPALGLGAPRAGHSDLLDAKKTGATLLISGVFLALAGVIFTTTGWQHYLATLRFEWTQLLGPILISVGGTFMLTSVCRFGMVSCLTCGRLCGDAGRGEEATERTSAGRSFTLAGVNQPVVLGGATMICLPPVYNFINQEVRQPGGSVNGLRAASPPYDSVYCVDFTAVVVEEEGSSERDHRRSRPGRTEGGGRHDDVRSSTCSRPPAYEDIYPPSSKPRRT